MFLHLQTFTDAKVSRNRAASTRTDSGAGAASVLPSSSLPSSSSSSSLPKTAHEFNRAWAACGSDARAQFKLLSGFPTKRLKRIFSMEVDPVLLASIVSCFQRVLAEGLEPSGTFPTPDGAGGEVDAKEPDASAGELIVPLLIILACAFAYIVNNVGDIPILREICLLFEIQRS